LNFFSKQTGNRE